MKEKIPAIINVAAGRRQISIIRKIKEMGFHVISIDRDPNAPGFSLSDFCILQSTHEPDKIIYELTRIKNRYDFKAVIGRSSGIPVFTVAKIAHKFNLRGIPPEVAKFLFDKSKLSLECSMRGIPVPRSISASCLKELNFDLIKFPAVIKPSIGLVGKRGVFYVNSKRELIERFDYTKKWSYNGKVQIEEFIKGHDITLMLVVYDGEAHIYATIDEFTKIGLDKNFYTKLRITPSNISSEKLNRLKNIIKIFIREFSIKNGILSVTFRVNRGDERIIEVNADLGGDEIIDVLLPLSMNGFDILKEVIFALTGKKPEFKFKGRTFAFMYYMDDLKEPLTSSYLVGSAKNYRDCFEKIADMEEVEKIESVIFGL